jgi:hypothetical protein
MIERIYYESDQVKVSDADHKSIIIEAYDDMGYPVFVLIPRSECMALGQAMLKACWINGGTSVKED